jgi:hypothetical protein
MGEHWTVTRQEVYEFLNQIGPHVKHAEASMKNKFGLMNTVNFLNIPFLLLRVGSPLSLSQNFATAFFFFPFRILLVLSHSLSLSFFLSFFLPYYLSHSQRLALEKQIAQNAVELASAEEEILLLRELTYDGYLKNLAEMRKKGAPTPKLPWEVVPPGGGRGMGPAGRGGGPTQSTPPPQSPPPSQQPQPQPQPPQLQQQQQQGSGGVGRGAPSPQQQQQIQQQQLQLQQQQGLQQQPPGPGGMGRGAPVHHQQQQMQQGRPGQQGYPQQGVPGRGGPPSLPGFVGGKGQPPHPQYAPAKAKQPSIDPVAALRQLASSKGKQAPAAVDLDDFVPEEDVAHDWLGGEDEDENAGGKGKWGSLPFDISPSSFFPLLLFLHFLLLEHALTCFLSFTLF